MSQEIFAKRLKEEMDKQNWTGRNLSKKANLSYNAIHYILSGKNKKTNFEVVSAISDILGVSTLYLLGESDNKKSKKAEIDVPYDGELYRQIMCVVEEILNSKNKLTIEQVEYFTKNIYPHVKKMQDEGKTQDIKSYCEGMIDYVLNQED
jgi:transcriptional regulator with XRE-family HTH domain